MHYSLPTCRLLMDGCLRALSVNKSTNKNANSHISREGTRPKSLPHVPFLLSLLSTKLHSLPVSLSLTHTFTVAHALSLSLSPSLLTGRRPNEEDRFTYLSFILFFHHLSSLSRLNPHSLSLPCAQSCSYISSCCQSKIQPF